MPGPGTICLQARQTQSSSLHLPSCASRTAGTVRISVGISRVSEAQKWKHWGKWVMPSRFMRPRLAGPFTWRKIERSAGCEACVVGLIRDQALNGDRHHQDQHLLSLLPCPVGPRAERPPGRPPPRLVPSTCSANTLNTAIGGYMSRNKLPATYQESCHHTTRQKLTWGVDVHHPCARPIHKLIKGQVVQLLHLRCMAARYTEYENACEHPC